MNRQISSRRHFLKTSTAIATLTGVILNVGREARAASFQRSGLAWSLFLTHQEVDALVGLGGGAAGANYLKAALPAEAKDAIPGILFVIGLLLTVDELGGNRGVTITGIIGTLETVVTPPGMSPFSDLSKLGAEIGTAGGSISDGWKHAGGVLSDIFHESFSASNPVTNLWQHILGHGGHSPQHTVGAVTADRQNMGPWETFIMFGIGGTTFSLLSHKGYFSAQSDGSVYANRGEVQGWEKWDLIRNGDGTWSFRSVAFNRYFTAEQGGGDNCNANRTAIGTWEKFWPVFTRNGVGLKTLLKGQFVSVQP